MSQDRGIDRWWVADVDDPADLAQETPATEMGPATITVTYVELDEDLWTAVWRHGTEHRDACGSLAKMISWARKQPADIWFLFDIEACDYVTLLPGSLGSA